MYQSYNIILEMLANVNLNKDIDVLARQQMQLSKYDMSKLLEIVLKLWSKHEEINAMWKQRWKVI